MNYAKRQPLSCLLIILIWVVCMIPVPETPLDNVAFMDKWTHFVMYGVLTTCIWVEYTMRHKRDLHKGDRSFCADTAFNHRLFIGGFVLPVMMGGLIELAQAYLTTCRSGDWFDFLCNSIGVVLGCIVGIIFRSINH